MRRRQGRLEVISVAGDGRPAKTGKMRIRDANAASLRDPTRHANSIGEQNRVLADAITITELEAAITLSPASDARSPAAIRRDSHFQ